jgi:lipopolysaccharide/colanic/teichoic acid biosynthesis glycosyltransferase
MIPSSSQSKVETRTRLITHRLHNSSSRRKSVLIITSYDYFLHKGDFRRLLRRYSEIILIPRSLNDDSVQLNDTVRPLLRRHNRIHLVTNPAYDQQHHVVYELVVRFSKSIRVSTVYDFCEQHLQKLYIPESPDERGLAEEALAAFSPATLTFKRLLDVLVAASLLLVSWPLWLLSAWRIRAESPGPVFYRQPRVGRNEAEFDCLKFRSMRPDAEANGAAFSTRYDKRTFRYGALMRATRIDELPQLVNVLRGEISLIGPRPERRVFTETFIEYVPHYAERHAVKPGITGYAQIRYPYGAGIRDARHKLMYDLYYVRNWSLWLELRILLETIVTVVTKQGW